MKNILYIFALLIISASLSIPSICEDFILDSQTPYISNLKISDVQFLPDNETIAVVDEGVLYLWDIKTKAIRKRTPGGFGAIGGLVISNDGKYIASGVSSDPFVYIFDGKTGELLYMKEHYIPIEPYNFSNLLPL